ncbi:phosphonopyruvate decarboxylase [Providencia burhodogranariea]|uniref:Phosphonopyruvate decarboxylase n=1 Tax=Providencia burhodogranariea DSM 19968 TaxID=1141662 RepID=K8WSS7_9GAMM|nr:phosphonopyruvate decarboxylase [Providencia burhodogranariea]EKT62991.1 phosphonopyruvate decarboxylase [Providencia burhodogranariea DSM 19968]
MIEPNQFVQLLMNFGIRSFSGVPDSLLKEFCLAVEDKGDQCTHTITANEGGAIGIAIGHYLATRQIPVVYMQNSGIGNAINPLCSLADIEVYGIPMLLIIGWRGELDESGEQISDEPQHVKQGKVTEPLLETLSIPTAIIGSEYTLTTVKNIIADAVNTAYQKSIPVALLVRKNIFSFYTGNREPIDNNQLPLRERALEWVISSFTKPLPTVCTTGMLSRELFELRNKRKESHNQDFLSIGGMGHASQITYGIALEMPNNKVICLDGDGALLMHLGGITNTSQAKNIIHIIFNNGVHDSVGGQKTQAKNISLSNLASACGYANVVTANDELTICNAVEKALISPSSYCIEILCSPGSRCNVGRPNISPYQSRDSFQKFLVTSCIRQTKVE